MNHPQDKNVSSVAAILAAAAIASSITLGYEGLVKVSRPDPVAIPTACYGHTAGVANGHAYTETECVTLAAQDIAAAGAAIAPCIARPIPLKTRAAFTDFAFNAGAGTFCKSSMARRTNTGDLAGACQALGLYIYAGRPPRILPGLVLRRRTETALCLEGVNEGLAP